MNIARLASVAGYIELESIYTVCQSTSPSSSAEKTSTVARLSNEAGVGHKAVLKNMLFGLDSF